MLCDVYFVAHSSDDSHFLLDFLFAQEIYLGGGQDRGMVSVIPTEWHLWVIKRSGSASKELTLPSLTFTKVEIKAPLQKINGNSNVQSATVFVRCLALTHAHTYTTSLTLMRGLWPADDVQVLSVIFGEDRVDSLVRTCPNLNKCFFSLH